MRNKPIQNRRFEWVYCACVKFFCDKQPENRSIALLRRGSLIVYTQAIAHARHAVHLLLIRGALGAKSSLSG